MHFPTVLAGGAPAEMSVPLHNEGADAIEWTIDGPKAPFRLPDPAVVRVEPGSTEEIRFAFEPQAAGSFVGWATLRSGLEVERVKLMGNAVPVELTCDERIDFGQQPLQTRRDRVVECTNHTELPIRLRVLPVTGEDAAFFTIRTIENWEVPPSTTFEIDVRSSATKAGERQASFDVQEIDTGATVTISLRAEHGPPSAGALLTCDAASLDFGTVAVGTGRTRTVHCINSGHEDPLFVTDLVSDDPEVALEIRNDDGSVGALPGGYEPGTGFDLAVTWSPASTRFLATTIHLHSNTDEPTTPIDLVGQARALEPCSLSVFPTELRFGQVEPGTEIRLDVHLRNVEATACLISDVRVGVEGDAAFQVEPIDELLLEPGQEHRIPVRFVAPPAQDEPVHVTGDLRFEVIDTDYVQHVVPLLGVSRNHCVTISQPNLEFLVEPGCQSQARSIEVSNGGCESAVEIQDIVLLGGPDCDGFDDGCAFEVVGPLLPEVVKEPLAFDIVYQPGGPAEDVGVALIYVSGESNPLAVGLHGHGQAAEFRTDTFDGEEPSRVDLLWVIDNSSCNTPAQLALADHLPTFLAFADQHAIDFQMGVTTTDVSDTGERGRLVPLPPSTGPRVLTSGMQNLEDLFAANVQVGTAGSSIEEGLEAAYLAMELRDLVDDPSTPEADDGNQGLVRDDAALSIIIVSDEADQSPRSPSTYAAYFRSLGRQDRVRVHGITPDPLTDCGYGPGVGERYQEVIDATGGHWASICDPDWSATLQELGRQAFDFDSLRGRYLLDSVPICGGACDDRDAPALQVKVAGTATPPWSGREQVWRYDAGENAIVFTQQARPAAGTTVEVTYRPQCAH